MHSTKLRLVVVFMVLLAIWWKIIPMASAREKSYHVLVPVFVLTDRDSKKYLAKNSATRQNQLSQIIRFGCIHVPIEFSVSEPIDIVTLKSWGCIFGVGPMPPLTTDYVEQELANPPGQHIEVSMGSLKPIDLSEPFVDRFAKLIESTSKKRMIVFIHGCCISSEASLKAAAMLSLHIGSPVLMYDWATPTLREAGALTYIQSDRALEISEPIFAALMQRIRQSLPNARITVIAHSMGARLLRDYLRRSDHISFDEIDLVRPDISLSAFLREQAQMRKNVGIVYILAAHNDFWLDVSSMFMSSNAQRLGSTKDASRWFAKQFNNSSDNTYIFDVSKLKEAHHIPFGALGFIHQPDLWRDRFEINIPFEKNSAFWILSRK